MTQPTCIHCELAIKPAQLVTYPQSGATAHRGCVSLPSFDETDTLILATRLATQLASTSPTRRVYSTGLAGPR